VRAVGLVLVAALAGCVDRGQRPDEAGSAAYSALGQLPSVGPTPFRPGELRGKVVLVNFFATWCFPCIAELPVLQKAQRDHQSQGFTVVMVGMDLEGEKMIAPFAAEYALPYPVLVADERLRAGETLFGTVRALPTNFLFDREGKIVVAYAGVASPENLLELVAREVRR
jgi:thiol-disulfide isomerase/thioredoxin